MRRLLLAAASTLLSAQGATYHGNTLVMEVLAEEPDWTRPPVNIPTLAFVSPEGRRRVLELPPELDGRLGRCVQIHHLAGTTYAVGELQAHLPGGWAIRNAVRQVSSRQPRRIYACGPDGRWRQIARMARDTTFRPWMLLPLGQDRFLYGNPSLCWQGDAISPFGVYRIEAGELKLERLVDLGLGGPWYQAVPLDPSTEAGARFQRGAHISEAYRRVEGWPEAWTVMRLPSGLFFLHRRSRRWFLMDDSVMRCLRQGRLGSDAPEEVLTAAVRPDGGVVVASRLGSAADRVEQWMRRNSIYDMTPPSPKGAEALLLARGQALDPSLSPQDVIDATWRVLDPVAGQAWNVAPPRGLTLTSTPLGVFSLRMAVRHDGSLELWDKFPLGKPRSVRYDWWQRLLRPFTFDWRKMEP